MKVKSSSSSTTATSVRSSGSRRSSGTGFADSLRETNSTASSVATSNTSSNATLLSINSILATQMVGSATQNNQDKEKKKELVSYAKDILDDLDEIHKNIVLGLMPKSKLLDITKRLKNRKTFVTDRKLMDIIEEVELRAYVELAKYNKQ